MKLVLYRSLSVKPIIESRENTWTLISHEVLPEKRMFSTPLIQEVSLEDKSFLVSEYVSHPTNYSQKSREFELYITYIYIYNERVEWRERERERKCYRPYKCKAKILIFFQVLSILYRCSTWWPRSYSQPISSAVSVGLVVQDFFYNFSVFQSEYMPHPQFYFINFTIFASFYTSHMLFHIFSSSRDATHFYLHISSLTFSFSLLRVYFPQRLWLSKFHKW